MIFSVLIKDWLTDRCRVCLTTEVLSGGHRKLFSWKELVCQRGSAWVLGPLCCFGSFNGFSICKRTSCSWSPWSLFKEGWSSLMNFCGIFNFTSMEQLTNLVGNSSYMWGSRQVWVSIGKLEKIYFQHFSKPEKYLFFFNLFPYCMSKGFVRQGRMNSNKTINRNKFCTYLLLSKAVSW